MAQVSLTFDFEDPLETYAPGGRYASMTRILLDICDEHHVKASFFTIGRMASAVPELVKDIAARGHEIAYHSHQHRSLTEETPARFRAETKTDKDRLEQLIGQKVVGFRAPRYSLTPDTLWTTAVLAELGFLYSSSIMPTRLSRFGFPGAPHTPFRWPSGLVELPLPIKKIGSMEIPYLGGIYLYTLPSFLTDRWRRQAPDNQVLWTYCHPYDIDRREKFVPLPHTPLWISFVLWSARRVAEQKIRHLIKDGAAPLMRERAEGLALSLPFFPDK